MQAAGTRGRCAIAIMAKTPRPGRSKTRLCPPLTPDQAAALSGAFLRDMADSVVRAGGAAPIDLVVAYAPVGEAEGLRALLPAGVRLVVADGAGISAPGVEGFGRALLQTLRLLLDDGYGAVCVLNADSPTLPDAYLAQAAVRLLAAPDRVVMGAASDGGYYLLGVGRDRPELLADIAWSTPTVAACTRERAGGMLDELPGWYDVDDAAGLGRLIGELDGGDGAMAPCTAAMLDRLGLRGTAAAGEQERGSLWARR